MFQSLNQYKLPFLSCTHYPERTHGSAAHRLSKQTRLCFVPQQKYLKRVNNSDLLLVLQNGNRTALQCLYYFSVVHVYYEPVKHEVVVRNEPLQVLLTKQEVRRSSIIEMFMVILFISLIILYQLQIFPF